MEELKIQVLDKVTGKVIDVETTANLVKFSDGETLQEKLDLGKLKGDKGETGEKGDSSDTMLVGTSVETSDEKKLFLKTLKQTGDKVRVEMHDTDTQNTYYPLPAKHTHSADEVSIKDINNKYCSNNVENALEEVMDKVSKSIFGLTPNKDGNIEQDDEHQLVSIEQKKKINDISINENKVILNDVAGNAASATKLQNAVSIFGKSFDGTNNIAQDDTHQLVTLEQKQKINVLSNPNILINGDFQVWQRGTEFIGNGLYYSSDRWRIDAGGSGEAKVTKEYDIVVGNYIRIKTSGYANLRYVLESLDINKIIGKQVTLSFYARKIEGNFLNAMYGFNSNATDSNEFTTEWKKFIITTTVSNQLEIYLTQFIISQEGSSVTFDIAQAKLELGEIATPFIPRSYAEELALCQRYYEKSYDTPILPGSATGFGRIMLPVLNNVCVGNAHFKVTKRIYPTLKIYDQNGDELSTSGIVGTENSIQVNTGYNLDNWFAFQYTADAEIY